MKKSLTQIFCRWIHVSIGIVWIVSFNPAYAEKSSLPVLPTTRELSEKLKLVKQIKPQPWEMNSREGQEKEKARQELIKYQDSFLEKINAKNRDARTQQLRQSLGGSSGGGGGGGLACFSSTEDIDACLVNGQLNPECLDNGKVLNLTTLDFTAVTSDDYSRFFAVDPGIEDWHQYLTHVLKTELSQIAPDFLRILLTYIDKADPSKWPHQELGLISDLGSRGELGAVSSDNEHWRKRNCGRVQIARRSLSDSPDGSRLFTFSYNKNLFSRLGSVAGGNRNLQIVNQAFLVLHEALYLMDAELNLRQTSNYTTMTVDQLLTVQSVMRTFRSENPSGMVWRSLKIFGFDRFYLLDDVSQSDQTVARRASYQKLFRIFREMYLGLKARTLEEQYKKTAYAEQGGFLVKGLLSEADPLQRDMLDVIEPRIDQDVLPQLSEADAFLLTAIDLEKISPQQQIDIMSLFFDGIRGNKTANKVCHEINKGLTSEGSQSGVNDLSLYKRTYKNGPQLLQKAAAYCSRIRGV